MKRVSGIGFILMAALLLALPLLAACGGDSETEPVTTIPATSAKPEPATTIPATPAKPEGTLTIAMSQLAVDPFLGPFGDGAESNRTVWAYVFDYLVCANSDFSGYVPWLAESWEIAPDGSSVTFQLRPGVQFHDGWGELTAEDVKFTIETFLNPDLSESTAFRTYSPGIIDRVETSGPYTVTIYSGNNLAEMVVDFLAPTDGSVSTPIACKAYYEAVGFEEANNHLIGSGPYRFVDYKMAENVRLEAVDEHWRAVPEFKNVVFREVLEETTRVAMIQTGEADIAQLGIEQAVTLQEKGYQVVTTPKGFYQLVWLLGQWLPSDPGYDPDSPFMQKEVRMAMNLAIDREEIAEALYYGMAEPTGDQQLPRWDDPLEPYPYDLDRAKQLMAEAGFPDGFKGELWITDMPGGQPSMYNVMLAVAGYWEKLGIDLEISQPNIMAVYGDILGRKLKSVCMNYQSTLDPTSGGRSYLTFGNSDILRFPMFAHLGFQEMINAVYAAQGLQARAAAEQAMIDFVYDEYVMVPLVSVDQTYVAGDRVGHWEPISLQYLDVEYITHADPLNTSKFLPEP